MISTLIPKRDLTAIQWVGTDESLAEVLDFLGPNVLQGTPNTHDNSILLRTHDEGNERVYVGNWIVKWHDDTLNVAPDYTIKQFFTLINLQRRTEGD